MAFKSVSQIKREVRAHASASHGSDPHGAQAAHGNDAHAHPEEKAFVPVFMPMGRTPGADTMNCRGRSGVPVHNMDVLTRGDVMEEITEDSMRSGNVGAAYKAWLLAVIFFVATVATMFVNVYVAGLFAYLTGFYYSERLLNHAWSIGWFKGKTLTYTV